jgi:hypothetical protein
MARWVVTCGCLRRPAATCRDLPRPAATCRDLLGAEALLMTLRRDDDRPPMRRDATREVEVMAGLAAGAAPTT